MKVTSKSNITILAAALAIASHASATTIFTDTFDSGTGAWYKAYNNGTDTALTNSSGSLSWSVGANGGDAYGVIGRSFSGQTLAVGDSILFSFDFTPTSDTGIVRVGLHDLSGGAAASADDWANTATGAYAGYATFFRSTGSNATRVEDGPMTTTANTAYPLYMGSNGGASNSTITTSGGSTDYPFVNNSTYQVSFEITRTSASQVDTLLTVLDGATTAYSVVGSQTSGTTYDAFNTAAVRISDGTALFDNVQVEVIPEPSAALLGGLGMLLMLRRRR